MILRTTSSRKRIVVPLVLCFWLTAAMTALFCYAQEAKEAVPPAETALQPATPDKEGLVSLNFRETDLREVLSILAYKGGINIVAGEDVNIKVSVQLKDVPWEQALDVILKTYNYTYKKEGQLVRVMSLTRSLEEEGKVPLMTKIISLNFADVNKLKESLSKMLSKRGTMEVDTRTNSLIVTDIPEMVEKIERAAQNLDTKTPQVLIEAMMVDVKIGKTDSWGSVLNLINNKSQNNSNTMSTDMGVTGAPTFAFNTLTDTLDLDAVLSFLITNNKATILANPKVLTLDNQEAKIEIIESIPYYESVDTGGGTTINVKFKDAGTKLFVTPHITSGRYISMNVKPEQSFKSAEVLDGQPVIDKRTAETNLLVRDGQTIVIGGLRQSKNTTTFNKVPFLGDVPVLGLFFKSKSIEKIDTELVLFVTPHIIYDAVMTDREVELFKEIDSVPRLTIDERTEVQKLKSSAGYIKEMFKAKKIEEQEIASRSKTSLPKAEPKAESKDVVLDSKPASPEAEVKAEKIENKEISLPQSDNLMHEVEPQSVVPEENKTNAGSAGMPAKKEKKYSSGEELDHEAEKFSRSLKRIKGYSR